MKSFSESYKAAGVDVTAGYKSVNLMREHVKKTFTSGVLQDVGGFGGLFMPNLSGMEAPVLVSGTDGVGTKLKLAFVLDKHDTIGIDCVAMCVNDILCSGAMPLFFLDYIATGKVIPDKIATIVKGIAEGCLQSSCALIGGETAEMPGFYSEGEYDIAGFSVGMVDKKNIIDGSNINIGDTVIGISSSGVHSNGFSLVRKIFKLDEASASATLNTFSDELGKTIGEALLCPTKIYVKSIKELLSKITVKAICHITGGGFYENMPRMLNKGTSLIIKKDFHTNPIFAMLQKLGGIPERDMYNTYNMGIGMALIVSAEKADEAVRIINSAGDKAFIIGEVIKGDSEIIIE